MLEYIDIANIKIEKFKQIAKNIVSDEVILTKERLMHILERHKEDFELYVDKLGYIITNPDYILEDIKNNDTIMVIKHIDKTNVNVIIKMAINNDKIHSKNSIMTLYRIRNKNLEKLMRKNKIIYIKE